jgi:hypothetical protein
VVVTAGTTFLASPIGDVTARAEFADAINSVKGADIERRRIILIANKSR